MHNTDVWIAKLWHWADTHNIPHGILPREEKALLNLTDLDLSSPDAYAKADNMKEHLESMADTLNSKPMQFSLSEEISKLKNLKRLEVDFRDLEYIPRFIGDMENLEVLSFAYNKLRGLPEEIETLTSLKSLTLTGNDLVLSYSQNLWIQSLQEKGCEVNHDDFLVTDYYSSKEVSKMDKWSIKNTYSRKPKKCPACKQENVAVMLYGYPTQEAFESGKYFIAGCTEDVGRQYHWGCLDCGFRLYKKRPLKCNGKYLPIEINLGHKIETVER